MSYIETTLRDTLHAFNNANDINYIVSSFINLDLKNDRVDDYFIYKTKKRVIKIIESLLSLPENPSQYILRLTKYLSDNFVIQENIYIESKKSGKDRLLPFCDLSNIIDATVDQDSLYKYGMYEVVVHTLYELNISGFNFD